MILQMASLGENNVDRNGNYWCKLFIRKLEVDRTGYLMNFCDFYAKENES